MGLKGGISIDADSGPFGYVLWCCGSRSWEVFTFFRLALAFFWGIVYFNTSMGSFRILKLVGFSKWLPHPVLTLNTIWDHWISSTRTLTTSKVILQIVDIFFKPIQTGIVFRCDNFRMKVAPFGWKFGLKLWTVFESNFDIAHRKHIFMRW